VILHRLDGCAPTPLAHYLKALGVLRLVSEQLDPEARGWWEGERFLLASYKDEDELIAFLLDKYVPTPMFNPWGARSGFYSGSSERRSREVLDRVNASIDPRFQPFKEAAAITRDVLNSITGGSKPDDAEGEDKAKLILALKRQSRGSSTAWLESVLAIVDCSTKSIQQPAIFGTGGSEGSGSYSAAFMKALDECLLQRKWDHGLRVSLFGSSDVPGQVWQETFGQFVPHGIGTPWDLLLAFEGACVVRSSVVKRSESVGDRWSASPFFVDTTSAGFASSSRRDEVVLNKGKELPGRGEQWFPLWSSPMTFAELQSIYRQGRAVTGRSRPTSGFSMARAVAALGVARGVSQFVRYGYLQRNNQATHFAVPLGRFVVSERAAPFLNCLDDLDAWLTPLRRGARDSDAPARLSVAERRLTDALFNVIQHPGEAARWQAVLLRMAEIEDTQVHGAGRSAGPVPRLRPEWAIAADDGSAEVRLAVALALQVADPRRGANSDGVRRHWITLDTKGRYQDSRSDRVMEGRSGEEDAIALVARRLTEAGQRGERRLPLEPGFGVAASRHDLARLLAGEVDLDRCLSLARTFMALDAHACTRTPPRLRSAPVCDWPDDAWMAIRLALLPRPLTDGRHPACDPAILRRLEGGDASGAFALAKRRLRAAGIACGVRAAAAKPEQARLYAAALAFPISPDTAARFVHRLDPVSIEETVA
jgi:CRISPR-associated protein Csx17